MAARQPFWKWHHWKSIGSANDHHQHVHEIWNWNSKANLTYALETMPPTQSRNQKSQYGCQAAILKMTSLKINRLLPIYISIVPLKFGVDIDSQTKVSESGNQKIQYGCQAAILKVTSLKLNRLLPMTTINMRMKFEIEISKQTWLMLRKPCHLPSPETKIAKWLPGGHFENDVAENR